MALKAKETYGLDDETIEHLASLATDYVIHFDQVFTRGGGTSDQSYVRRSEEDLFAEMLKAASEKPRGIDLDDCIDDLIRKGKIGSNLDKDVFPS